MILRPAMRVPEPVARQPARRVAVQAYPGTPTPLLARSKTRPANALRKPCMIQSLCPCSSLQQEPLAHGTSIEGSSRNEHGCRRSTRLKGASHHGVTGLLFRFGLCSQPSSWAHSFVRWQASVSFHISSRLITHRKPGDAGEADSYSGPFKNQVC